MLQRLYILPFDHRGSFIKMFDFSEQNLTAEQAVTLADYKHIVYEGFLAALKMGVSKNNAAILVDEQSGAKILEEAGRAGITRLLAVEKSGQEEFDFEYGRDFGAHIEKFKPDYVKVLVRYNPAGDEIVNARQSARLKIVSDFCRENGCKFLFELLTKPSSDMKSIKESMKQLQAAGIEPDIWKIEGLETSKEMREVVEQARVGVVVLGRGESEAKVREWMRAAVQVKGVVGFAVGRTVFKKPLLDYHQKRINRERAVKDIAQNYKNFVDLFESAQNKINN